MIFTNPNDSNKQIIYYDHFDNNNSYGFAVSRNLDFKKWWIANISFVASNKKSKRIIEDMSRNYEFVKVALPTFNALTNYTFKATKSCVFNYS